MKICKNSVHLNQFIVFLFDCVPNMKQLSIDKLLENASATLLGTGKNPIIAFYSENIKSENFLMKQRL